MIIALMVLLGLLATIVTWISIKAKKNALQRSFHSIDKLWRQLVDLAKQITDYAQKKQIKDEFIPTEHLSTHDSSSWHDQQIVINNKMKKEISLLINRLEKPEALLSNHDFNHLQRTWNDTRFQLESACNDYVQSVVDYNNKLSAFPGSLLAGMLQLEPIEDCGLCAEADADFKTLKFH